MDATDRTSQNDPAWQQGFGRWLLTHPGTAFFVVSLTFTIVAIAAGWPDWVCVLAAIPAVVYLLFAGDKSMQAVEAREAERAEQYRRKQLDLEAERIVEREEAIERARERRREAQS